MATIRTIFTSLLLASAFLPGGAATARAQSSDWEFSASVYLFTPETTTRIGGVESVLSFPDALANLDIAFMGAFEARNGRWGLIADYMLNDLTFNGDTPGPIFTGAQTSLKTEILSGYLAYRVVENAGLNMDVVGGFRWFNIRSGITLLGGPPTPTANFGNDWVDPVIGARAQMQFNDRWSGVVFADYGGFGGDSETWQVLLTVGYDINDHWSLRGGYRMLSIDRTENGTNFSFTQSGPILGATYRF